MPLASFRRLIRQNGYSRRFLYPTAASANGWEAVTVARSCWKRRDLLSALLRYVPLFYFASSRPLRIPGHYRLCPGGFRLRKPSLCGCHRRRRAVHLVTTLVFLPLIPLILLGVHPRFFYFPACKRRARSHFSTGTLRFSSYWRNVTRILEREFTRLSVL